MVRLINIKEKQGWQLDGNQNNHRIGLVTYLNIPPQFSRVLNNYSSIGENVSSRIRSISIINGVKVVNQTVYPNLINILRFDGDKYQYVTNGNDLPKTFKDGLYDVYIEDGNGQYVSDNIFCLIRDETDKPIEDFSKLDFNNEDFE